MLSFEWQCKQTAACCSTAISHIYMFLFKELTMLVIHMKFDSMMYKWCIVFPTIRGCFSNHFLLDYCDSIKYADFTSVEMLKCGNADIYIKPECVCSFYNVFKATLYHGYSSCPDDQRSDIVTQLKCRYKTVIMNNFSSSYRNHKYIILYLI